MGCLFDLNSFIVEQRIATKHYERFQWKLYEFPFNQNLHSSRYLEKLKQLIFN